MCAILYTDVQGDKIYAILYTDVHGDKIYAILYTDVQGDKILVRNSVESELLSRLHLQVRLLAAGVIRILIN